MSAAVSCPETSATALADAAFGAYPGGSAAELPEPADGLELWWRAVALGGTGHYAAARGALRRLRNATTDPALRSLAASTAGSLRRQLGRHADAAHDDGAAAALVLPGLSVIRDDLSGAAARRTCPAAGDGYRDVPDRLDAAADALTGLAADALGTGRTVLAGRLLDRCAVLLDTAPADRPRARVRLHWVRAETALAEGRAAAALPEAEAALELSVRGPSVRHQVKSRLLVAAAAGATGDLARAAALAGTVDAQCAQFGLLPLRWACAMLRTGLPGNDRDTAAGDAAACHALIAQRGGRFGDAGR
ncbi:hypothetical protein [Nocardia sp. NPDC024068]|uniref:hypothetical protein n=1 Tax=Nocardia sp. NPDC024068 TaxID=3157197 RepID=UPI0033F22C74